MKIVTDNQVVKVIDFEPVERSIGIYCFPYQSYPIGKTIPSYLRIFKDKLEMEVLEFVGVKGADVNRFRIRKMKIDFVDLFKVNQLIKRVSEGKGDDFYASISSMLKTYYVFEEISKKEEEKK